MSKELTWIRLISPTCRRRWRVLKNLGSDALLFQRGSTALSPAAWIAFLLLFMLVVQGETTGLTIACGIGLFIGLCVISLFDLRYLIIPDGPLIYLCFLAPLTWITLDLQETAFRFAAAAIGYLTLRLTSQTFEAVRGQAGFGTGDARLFAVAGLWLGLSGLPGCLLYSTVSALVWSVIARHQGELADPRQPIPFAPHLALGIWVSYVLGPIQFG